MSHSTKSTHIQILHQNLQHCHQANHELNINATNHKADILCIQEPIYEPDSDGRLTKITGIKDYSYPLCKAEPRCAILTNIKEHLLLEKYLTRTCVCVLFNTKPRPFILCCVYYSRGDNDLTNQLTHLTKIIMENPQMSIIITGDFNGWHSYWGSPQNDPRGEEIFAFMCGNNLDILNDGITPTYAPPQSPNTRTHIDLTFINQNASLYASKHNWAVLEDFTGSDHRLLSFKWEAPSNVPYKSITRQFKTSNINWMDFDQAVSNRLLPFDNKVTQLNSKEEVETFVCSLTDQLHQVCVETLPAIKPSNKRDYCSSPELEQLRRETNTLLRRVQRLSDGVLKQLVQIRLNEKWEIYKKLTETTQLKSVREFFSTQTKETAWAVYKKLCSPSKLNNSLRTIKTASGWTKDVDETAGCLMERFFPDNTINNQFQESITRRASMSYIEPDDPNFTMQEVDFVIKIEDDTKSPGHDAISANIIKQLFRIFPLMLYHLFNKCLNFSIFPTAWKSSVVKVIPKASTGDSTSANSFRPISLLPVMGKIFENLINRRLTFLLYSVPNGISFHQFGFTPQLSAEEAINEIVNRQTEILTKQRFGIFVSLDISGAFDSAWWDMVLVMLREYRIPANLYWLISNYFSDREAKLPLCGNVYSKALTRGCPQGAKCSPLLWNVLYSNLMKLTLPEGCYLQAFADDSFLVVDGKDEFECELKTNAALKMIAKWGEDFKLNFNPSKTHAMMITRRTKITIPAIHMNGVQIQLEPNLKYLGVILDSKQLWNAHVKYICTKSHRMMQNIKRATGRQWGWSGEVLRTIYIGAIEPIFTYASSAWSEAVKKDKIRRQLLSAQRGFALLITKSYHTVSMEASILLANIVPLHLRIKMWSAQYSIKHNNPPAFLHGLEYQRSASFLENGHPATHKNFVTNHCDKLHNCSIYTDGSKLDGQTGCAFVVYLDGIIHHSQKERLANHCSVFQAEQLAIQNAVKWCRTNNMSATIYSDSKSSLDDIQNCQSTNPFAVDIRNQLRNYSNHVCLKWVKAHAGNEGNEEADKLAKEATLNTEIGYQKYPLSFAMKLLNQQMINDWNEEWQKAKNGGGTKIFFPTVSDRRNCTFIPDFITNQFLTGHGKFRAYFERFDVTTHPPHPPHCDCNTNQPQEVPHLINDCPQMLTLTDPFHHQVAFIHNRPNPHPNLYCSNETYDLFHKMCSAIHNELIASENRLLANRISRRNTRHNP